MRILEAKPRLCPFKFIIFHVLSDKIFLICSDIFNNYFSKLIKTISIVFRFCDN